MIHDLVLRLVRSSLLSLLSNCLGFLLNVSREIVGGALNLKRSAGGAKDI